MCFMRAPLKTALASWAPSINIIIIIIIIIIYVNGKTEIATGQKNLLSQINNK